MIFQSKMMFNHNRISTHTLIPPMVVYCKTLNPLDKFPLSHPSLTFSGLGVMISDDTYSDNFEPQTSFI